MNVQIRCRAKALERGEPASVGFTTLGARLLDQKGRDDPNNDLQQRMSRAGAGACLRWLTGERLSAHGSKLCSVLAIAAWLASLLPPPTPWNICVSAVSRLPAERSTQLLVFR